MRSLVRVTGANCSCCMNAVREELLARPLVHDVWQSATKGCLEVDHDHDDPGALIEILRRSLHAWEVADNGEIISVATTPEPMDHCPWHADVQ